MLRNTKLSGKKTLNYSENINLNNYILPVYMSGSQDEVNIRISRETFRHSKTQGIPKSNDVNMSKDNQQRFWSCQGDTDVQTNLGTSLHDPNLMWLWSEAKDSAWTSPLLL